MGPDLGIIEIINWVTYLFPSFSVYIKILAPIFILGVSVIGIFSNILPLPMETYPVPSLEDINTELKGKGVFVYRFTRLSRRVTITINRIICGKSYKCFYNCTDKCSTIISYVRGSGKKAVFKKFTPPKPFQLDLDKYTKKKEEQNEDK
jgi:hypothetical protein